MIKKIIYFLFFLLIISTSTSKAEVFYDCAIYNMNNENYGVMVSLGDSITKGVGSTDTFGYRKNFQIYTNLTYTPVGQYSDPAFDATYGVKHSSVMGNTTSQVETLATTVMTATYLTTVTPGVVLLHTGTNDDHSTQVKIDASVQNVKDIIDIIDAYNPYLKVYVALILPDTTIGGDTVNYNTSLATMLNTYKLTKTNLHIVDMYSAAVNDTFSLCNGDFITNCSSDSVHPNNKGYEVMARQWYACLIDSNSVNCDGN